MSIRYILIFLLLQSFTGLCANESDSTYLKFQYHPWVDSVFNSLSPKEKIGQLIWIKAFSDGDIGQDVWMSDIIRKSEAGGIILSEGFTADKQTEMINYFQKITRVPLLIAEEGECGLKMTLDGIVNFPCRITLGAIWNDSLIYRMGKSVANQFKRAGIHVNLAHLSDVNNNQQNPVLNCSSFGENPENINRKTLMYMNGLQDDGIISAVKYSAGKSGAGMEYYLKGGAGLLAPGEVFEESWSLPGMQEEI